MILSFLASADDYSCINDDILVLTSVYSQGVNSVTVRGDSL